MLPTRITTLPVLFLELSPFDLFFKLIWCPLCNFNTLRNILIVFGRNEEQDKTMCCIQEWQLCLSNFWCYLPFLYLTVIMPWFFVCSGSNLEQDEAMCCVQKWQLWLSYFCSYLPFLYLNQILYLLYKSNTLHNILMILGRKIEQDEMTCPLARTFLLLLFCLFFF